MRLRAGPAVIHELPDRNDEVLMLFGRNDDPAKGRGRFVCEAGLAVVVSNELIGEGP